MAEYGSLDKAWHSEMRVVPVPDEECSICYTTWSPSHQPVSSVGPQSCAHVVGDLCLRQWFKYKRQMSCPMCRQLRFVLDDNEGDLDGILEDDDHDELDSENDGERGSFGESEEEGDTEEEYEEDNSATDDEDWATNADSLVNIAVAVEHLHERKTAAVLVSTLYCALRNTENNVSDHDLKEVVEEALLDWDLHASTPLPDTLWAQMRRMSRRILRDSKVTNWNDQIEYNWIRRL